MIKTSENIIIYEIQEVNREYNYWYGCVYSRYQPGNHECSNTQIGLKKFEEEFNIILKEGKYKKPLFILKF